MSEHWSMRYLRHVIAASGVSSASALAKLAGVSSTTLTRPLNDPEHSFFLSRRTLDSIQKVTGISYAPFASTADKPLDQMDPHELLDVLSEDGREKVRQYILFVKSQEETS